MYIFQASAAAIPVLAATGWATDVNLLPGMGILIVFMALAVFGERGKV